MEIRRFLKDKRMILALGGVLVVALAAFGAAAYFRASTDEARPSLTTKNDSSGVVATEEQKKDNDQDLENSNPTDVGTPVQAATPQAASSNTTTATRPSPPTFQGDKPWRPPVARDFTLSSSNTITLSPGSVSGRLSATMNDGSVVSWHGSPNVYQGITPPEAMGQPVVMVIESNKSSSVFHFHIWVSPDAKPASGGLLITAYDNPGATISRQQLTVVIQ